eukprot:Em0005g753a
MDADIEDDESDVEGKDLAAKDFEIHKDDEEDDLFKDPDFIDSAKKKANRAFVIKWKYKIIEAVLNSGRKAWSRLTSRIQPRKSNSLQKQLQKFCRLIHLARTIPPSLAGDALSLFDDEAQQCFAVCTAVGTPDFMWQQAQLSLPQLSVQAYLMRFVGTLNHSIDLYNNLVDAPDSLLTLLTTAAPHSLRSSCLAPQLEMGGWSREYTRPADVLIPNWVLANNQCVGTCSTSAGSAAYAAECRKHEANDTKCQELGWTCIPLAVETFGHWEKEAQAVFSRLASFIAIHRASPKSSVLNEIYSQPQHVPGRGWQWLRACKRNTRPADVLVTNCSLGKLATFDLTVTSPLNPSILSKAGVTAGFAAKVAECRKHDMSDPKCSELGLKCTPLALETYGCWGAEAWETLSHLATCLAISMRCTKSQATAAIYGRLSLTLLPLHHSSECPEDLQLPHEQVQLPHSQLPHTQLPRSHPWAQPASSPPATADPHLAPSLAQSSLTSRPHSPLVPLVFEFSPTFPKGPSSRAAAGTGNISHHHLLQSQELPILVLALIPRSAVGQSEALGLLEYQLPPPQPLLARAEGAIRKAVLFAVGDEAMEQQDDDDGREMIEQLKEKFTSTTSRSEKFTVLPK